MAFDTGAFVPSQRLQGLNIQIGCFFMCTGLENILRVSSGEKDVRVLLICLISYRDVRDGNGCTL